MRKLSEEKRLYEIIQTYDMTEDHSLWTSLTELEKKTESPDIIIPILGTQGMGKSTLINAFLGEDIMPSEADETTCIPVEIRYGQENAEVFFKNGTILDSKCDKNELAQYVDNVYNPANKKGVSHIVIHKEYPVLKNGTVIVDLPGVGSLTKENEETTRKYIENLCAAVFIIPTSPPITRSQASFIKAVWRGVSNAFFVQNVWVDNAPNEVEEGMNFNQNVITGIAKDIGANAKNEIIPVNAYNAAKGVFCSDDDLVSSSNIIELKQKLDGFAGQYTEAITSGFHDRILNTLTLIQSEIEKRIRECQLSKEDLLSELNKERKLFQSSSDEMENIIRKIRNKVSDKRRESRRFAEGTAKKKAEILRAEVFHLIEGGVVDGDQLSDAFSGYQTDYGAEAIDEAYEQLCRIIDELSDLFEELQSTIDKEIMESVDAEQFYKEQQIKWEKGVQVGIDIASSAGGVVIGAIVTGAISGSWAGPIGAGVGIAIALVGVAIGGGIRKAKLNQRISETKSEITPYIKSFETNTKSAIQESFTSFFDWTEDTLDDFRESRKKHLNDIDNRISEIKESGIAINDSIDVLKNDLYYVQNWR